MVSVNVNNFPDTVSSIQLANVENISKGLHDWVKEKYSGGYSSSTFNQLFPEI